MIVLKYNVTCIYGLFSSLTYIFGFGLKTIVNDKDD